MVGAAECIVSFGSGVAMRWDRTQDGNLTITLRPAEGVRRSEPLQFRSEQTSKDTITFRVISCYQLTNDQNNASQALEDQDEKDVRKLREKLAMNWRKRRQTMEQDASRWSANFGTFFSNTGAAFSERWSFMFLNDSEKNLHLERAPFHKANLSTHLTRRLAEARSINPGFLEVNCRKTMMAEIYPGFENLTREQKRPLYAKFERYINQGNILLKIASIHAGVLLTVAQFLSTKDFGIVSSHLEGPSTLRFAWLGTELLKESTKYRVLASSILQYMHAEAEHSASISQKSHSCSVANLKRAYCLQDDWTRKRQQLSPNAMKLVDTHQGTLPPTLEPSKKYLNTEQQKAYRIKGSLDGNMQPYSASEVNSASSSLSTEQQSQLISTYSELPRLRPASGFFRELLPERLSTSYLPVIQGCSNDKRLLSFYLHHLCPSRTLFKSNLYLDILQVYESEDSVRYSILALAASYLKDETEPEYRYCAVGRLKLSSARSDSQIRAILGATSLLLQSTVIRTDLREEWITHVQTLPKLLQWAIRYPQSLAYRMRLAAHHVLANTVAGQATMFEHAAFLSDKEKSIKDIDGLIGLSPELLDIIQDITMLPSAMSGGPLKSRLLKLTQELLDVNLTAGAKRVIISTAETYRLSALLFLEYRFPGTLDQKETADTEDVLIQTLEDLPMSGPLYTALHPLWSLFMCSMTTVRHRARLELMLEDFTYPPTSNIAPAIDAIRRVWAKSPTCWQEVIATIGCHLSLT